LGSEQGTILTFLITVGDLSENGDYNI
jgi:hypothetical protein